MVRWPAGLHPQAAKRDSSMLAWRPGWRQTGMQPIARVPIGRYTGRISQVPLTGGQAQGFMSGAAAGPVSGSLNAPSSFAGIAVLTVTQGGTYRVSWTVTLSGTVSSTELNNFQIYKNAGGSALATSVNAAADGSYVQAAFTVTLLAGDQLDLTNPLAGTAGSVYGGTLSAVTTTGGNCTLQVGPQALGTVWYPVSVTLSTSTGVLDTSTALVYLGPAATPATLQASVFSGNGTAALAIPSMSPGQTIIAAWTGGHPGDTAAMNITGSMDALSTR